MKRLTTSFSDKIRLDCPVSKVIKRDDKNIVIDEQGNEEAYDRVVFACHADEALKMIEGPSVEQEKILGAFDYQTNHIVVHRDTSFMTQNKKCWASWIYLSEQKEDHNSSVSLSYWMNNLQGLDENYPIIVTLNPGRQAKEDLMIQEHYFSHPIFDLKAIKAQNQVSTMQGKDNFWFCGAYQRYGFHEDGLLSAVNVAKSMGLSIPWE